MKRLASLVVALSLSSAYVRAMAQEFPKALQGRAFDDQSTYQARIIVGGIELVNKGQIAQLYERDGLTAKNANLLPLLFQDLTAADVDWILSKEVPSLRLAVGWQVVLQRCLVDYSKSVFEPRGTNRLLLERGAGTLIGELELG